MENTIEKDFVNQHELRKTYAAKFVRGITLIFSLLLVLVLLPFPHGQAAQISYEERFGYSQLKSAAEQRAYLILEEQVGKVAESFVVSAEDQITLEDMESAANALALDRPDLFYFIYGNLNILQFQNGALSVNPRYILHNKATPELSTEALLAMAGQKNYVRRRSSMLTEVEETPGITLEEIRAAKQAYESKIGRILQSIPATAATEHDKVKFLHDYLANTISYQYTANDQNAYSAIVEGETVCAGYARAYQDLLSRLGIRCWFVTGYAGQAHAWNVLWLDGECVYTDVTWADQETFIRYTYYNISKEQMDKDHTMDPEYAAVLGNCNHQNHMHKLTMDNVEGAVAKVFDYHFPDVGSFLRLNYSQSSEAVVFHSSNSAVADVTDDGVITMVGEGSAVITVILEDQGCAYQYFITVGTPHQHVLTPVSEKPATCCSYGSKSHYKCESCGKLFEDAAGQQEITDKKQLRIPYNSDHGVLVRVEGASATCTANGKKDYWRCDGCGKSFFDSNGTRLIGNFNDLLIPAAGHSEGNWEHDADHHWKNCRKCGQLLDQSVAAHTESEQGDHCSFCGYKFPERETIPTQPTEPPRKEPAQNKPTQSEPVDKEPPATDPIVTEPPATVPTETEPRVTEPVVEPPTEPATPVETKPTMTESTEPTINTEPTHPETTVDATESMPPSVEDHTQASTEATYPEETQHDTIYATQIIDSAFRYS